MRLVAQLMDFFEKIGEGGSPEEANKLFGAPQTTLEQWCKKQSGTA